MQRLKLTNLVLLVILAIASAMAKILKLPDELLFFQQAGFNELSLVSFGVIQLVSGLAMTFNKFRASTAIVLALTFLVSTILIFMAGKIGFGIFSVLPIVMCWFVVRGERKLTMRTQTHTE